MTGRRSEAARLAETERVRQIWAKFAPRYDRQIAFFERILFGGAREWACSRARGDVLDAGGVREPAAVLRPVISYAAGYGYAERSMLGVQCGPAQTTALSERELLLYLGQALPPGAPPELASAAVAMIAECDPDRCFEEGLDLMLAGVPVSPGRSRKRGHRS